MVGHAGRDLARQFFALFFVVAVGEELDTEETGETSLLELVGSFDHYDELLLGFSADSEGERLAELFADGVFDVPARVVELGILYLAGRRGERKFVIGVRLED